MFARAHFARILGGARLEVCAFLIVGSLSCSAATAVPSPMPPPSVSGNSGSGAGSGAAGSFAAASGGSHPGTGSAGVATHATGGLASAGVGGKQAMDLAGGGAIGGAGMGQSTASGGGAAGTAGAGGSVPVSYPALDPTQIGNPVMIANTFTLAESPLWDPCQHRLLFVDVQGGGGSGTIHSLGADGQITTFMTNTNNTNGIAFDIDGSLILAQMGGRPGHMARRDKSGMVTIIDPPGSPPFHTPDDVIVRSDGTIYFSDGDFPPIGMIDLLPLPVYGIKPQSAGLINGGTVGGPNGVELSPDEKTLYVDAYSEGLVYSFQVAADGSLTKGAPLNTILTNPDSLCLDAAGNLYVGVSTGLHVMRPDGSTIKDIPIASTSGTTNCTLGGDDGKTLYITAWKLLLKVEGMPIPGLDWVVNTKRLVCQ